MDSGSIDWGSTPHESTIRAALRAVSPDWLDALAPQFSLPYFKQLAATVDADYAAGSVYPPAPLIFAALAATPLEEVKVVIIGQDPYHGPGQACGLAFAVNPGIAYPPSLRNILQEVAGEGFHPDGDLRQWARQGVLLLNSVLTVRAGQPRSHAGIGWEIFTDAVVQALTARRSNLVFLLWGSDARRKCEGIPADSNLLLCAPHPSPLSAYRGFFGCGHFRLANDYLLAHGLSPIQW